jgi:hypothetical protein
MANYQPCGAFLNIVSSKAAILLAWLTKPTMIQYHLQKLNQAGKATHSIVQLPVTMYDTKLFTVIARTYLINFYP